MAEEIKRILTVETGRSFDNIRQLRAEISQLNRVVETGTKLIADENGELQEVKVTSQEYDAAVKQLAEDKRTLADVTNLNRNAWNEEATAVDRSQKSYAQLQAEMRRLRVEWRNTASADDRQRIGAEIKDITDRLKEMDAQTGFFQRNVGDYFNAIQKGIGALPGPIKNVNTALTGTVNALKQIAISPALGALALFATLLGGMAKAWKDASDRIAENEEAQRRAAAEMDKAQAISDLYTKKLDEMGGAVSRVSAFFEETKGKVKVFFATLTDSVLQSEGVFDFFHRLVDGLHDAGNAVEAVGKNVDAELEEQKKLVETARVAHEKYIDTYRVSVKRQAELNREIAEGRRIAADSELDMGERLDAVNKSIDATRKLYQERVNLQKLLIADLQAEAARTANSTETKNKLAEAEANLIDLQAQEEQTLRRLVAQRANLNKEINAYLEGLDSLDEVEAYDAEMTQQAADMMDQVAAGRVQAEDEMTAAIVADAKERIGIMDLEGWKDKQRLDEEKKRNQGRKMLARTYGDTVATVFDSIADIIESSSEEDEKAQKGVKALRIAAATIDTISAAVSSYNAMAGIPYVGPALGAAAAASATAMGIANIAKIRATDVSRKSSSTGSGAGSSTPIIAAPPAVVQEVPVTRTLTGASEAEQANAPAETKVVLVMSELEAKQGEIAAKQVETTF